MNRARLLVLAASLLVSIPQAVAAQSAEGAEIGRAVV